MQSQCMYATRPLKCKCNVSTSSLVSCLVSCLLYASVPIVVCDDAVVRRTLVLIAFHRSHCFHVVVSAGFCCIGGIVFTHPVGDSKLLLTVTEF